MLLWKETILLLYCHIIYFIKQINNQYLYSIYLCVIWPKCLSYFFRQPSCWFWFLTSLLWKLLWILFPWPFEKPILLNLLDSIILHRCLLQGSRMHPYETLSSRKMFLLDCVRVGAWFPLPYLLQVLKWHPMRKMRLFTFPSEKD